MALDRGRVKRSGPEDGHASEPVCEVELELKRGSPSDVFALARVIGNHVPVRIGVESKAERGFDLDDPHAGALPISVTLTLRVVRFNRRAPSRSSSA